MDRRGRNALITIGLGVILLFAVIGVVSAGIFLGSHVAGSTGKLAVSTVNPRKANATLADARAQATRIVRAAHSAAGAEFKRDTKRAKAQAASILARARRHAGQIIYAAAASASAAPTAVVSAPQVVPTPTVAPYSSTGPSTANGTTTGSTTQATPDLSTLPASWYVVAYNATFGAGPGSAGGITVTNRGHRTYSGTARVVYSSGGGATASFTLAPGQTAVLPLNGPKYDGKGFTISVNV